MTSRGEITPLRFAESLRQSSDDFARLIQPLASEALRGKFEIVEGVTTYEVAKALDMQAGIDLWFVRDGGGIRGLANRVQRTTRNWRTFTVRKERASGNVTEYEKRVQAIKREWLYPVLTLQGYVTPDGSALISFAIAHTKDILSVIGAGGAQVQHTGAAQRGQASFYVVGWDSIVEAGYWMYEWPA